MGERPGPLCCPGIDRI